MKVTDVFSWLPADEISIKELELLLKGSTMEHMKGHIPYRWICHNRRVWISETAVQHWLKKVKRQRLC